MKAKHFITRKEAKDFKESDIEYFKQLEVLVNQIIDKAVLVNKWSFKTLANKADLSPKTVDNLGNFQTKFPQFRTVQKLATAIGWNIKFSKGTKNKFRVIHKLKAG